jgi:GxxExxY protein
MADIIYKGESFQIMGACFEVYKEKGPGFTEPIYHECLGMEFAMQSIPALSKPRLPLAYKGLPLQHLFEPDFLCFEKVIVELKAVSHLNGEHRAQVMNYLKATHHKLGLLVNFAHHPQLEYERIVAADHWSSALMEKPDLRI